MMASVRLLFKKSAESARLLLCVVAAMFGLSSIEAATPTRPFTPLKSEIVHSYISATQRSIAYTRAILDFGRSASADFDSRATILNIAILRHGKLANTVEQINMKAPLICSPALAKKHISSRSDEDSSIHS
ncbi:hypothetical protein [uncultured Imperialibacter sp.]|uniref:hypothetical protein n=1 Tax=uncultured Imperialibacter sp. TaxID=1672639 RepID=UPI0030D75BD0|tara:strand:+ start:1781 stop:2173 length:393 start_codon:yes stop_codon:yes gene_type:complete